MSDTFREAVTKIVEDAICRPSVDSKVATDRILAAHDAELDRIARGMPIVVGGTSLSNEDRLELPILQLEKCQAYIQAQKEGM